MMSKISDEKSDLCTAHIETQSLLLLLTALPLFKMDFLLAAQNMLPSPLELNTTTKLVVYPVDSPSGTNWPRDGSFQLSTKEGGLCKKIFCLPALYTLESNKSFGTVRQPIFRKGTLLVKGIFSSARPP
jgi:hypothetical protein